MKNPKNYILKKKKKTQTPRWNWMDEDWGAEERLWFVELAVWAAEGILTGRLRIFFFLVLDLRVFEKANVRGSCLYIIMRNMFFEIINNNIKKNTYSEGREEETPRLSPGSSVGHLFLRGFFGCLRLTHCYALLDLHSLSSASIAVFDLL